MKITTYLLLALLAVSLTTSCNRSTGNATITVDTLVTDEAETEALLNSMSIDFEGVLPCADCPGIATLLHLNKDSMTYFLTEIYKGKADSVFMRSGSYRLMTGIDSTTSILEISGVKEAGPRYYELSGDTVLYVLDKDARRTQGDQNNALRKKQE
ncbi:MAG: copper resistance protein NlpE [Bacteroidia bacterium]